MSLPTTPTIEIAGRHVGAGSACFIIAEGGVNHNGSVDRAHQLIDVASSSGADAIKFQTFDPGAVVSSTAGAAPYQRARGAVDQNEMLRALALPEPAWEELSAHAQGEGLVFLSTAFDRTSLELVVGLGVEVLKVPSGELDNLAFIHDLAAFGLPLIISTGLGTLDEVAAAVDAAGAAEALAVLHCVTSYPASPESSNLLAMQRMGEQFEIPVGWSDHTNGALTAVAAVALGASILEKHVTTSHELSGPDHQASADPEEFADYVRAVRQTSAALGDGEKRPTPEEETNRRFVRRSWHVNRDLPAGHVLRDDDVQLLRPADGISPATRVTDRVLNRPMRGGEVLRPEDLH